MSTKNRKIWAAGVLLILTVVAAIGFLFRLSQPDQEQRSVYGAAAHLRRTKSESVIEQLTEIAQNPEGFYPVRGAQRRYPLSTYIKKKMRGRISGFLCDELHEYNNSRHRPLPSRAHQ